MTGDTLVDIFIVIFLLLFVGGIYLAYRILRYIWRFLFGGKRNRHNETPLINKKQRSVRDLRQKPIASHQKQDKSKFDDLHLETTKLDNSTSNSLGVAEKTKPIKPLVAKNKPIKIGKDPELTFEIGSAEEELQYFENQFTENDEINAPEEVEHNPFFKLKVTTSFISEIEGQLPEEKRYNNQSLITLLDDAISSKKPLKILYYGGTRAGEPREIIPIEFSRENQIKAICLIDNIEKYFYINRILVKDVVYPTPLYPNENKRISFSISGIGAKTNRKRKAKIYKAFSKQEALQIALDKHETVGTDTEVLLDEYASNRQINYLDLLGLAYPPNITKKEATSYLTSHLDFDTMSAPRESTLSIAKDNDIEFDRYTSDELLSQKIEFNLSI